MVVICLFAHHLSKLVIKALGLPFSAMGAQPFMMQESSNSHAATHYDKLENLDMQGIV